MVEIKSSQIVVMGKLCDPVRFSGSGINPSGALNMYVSAIIFVII